MENKKISPIPIVSSSRGWALVYVLVFCVVIQGIALLAAGFITHDIRSGSVFQSILAGRHAPPDTRPAVEVTRYGAPEGWDNACFLTEVTGRRWENESAFTWRVKLGSQPAQAQSERSLSSWKPFVILLVDDSAGMLASSGQSYENGAVFFERSGREVAPCADRDDFASVLVETDGTYFRGSFGNSSRQAADLYGFGGVSQCWTQALSRLTSLVEDLDLCPMAVATVSRGVILPFTSDRKALLSALAGIRPRAEEAGLAEACLSMAGQFPAACGTARHIVIATSGVAVKDGDIPSFIKDFDHDGNPLDTAVEERSHCLDDVAAYAASQGVTVHAVGPDTPFLRDVAAKGKGAFMPTKGAFSPPGPFICQPPRLSGNLRRYPVNTELAFNPPWLDMDSSIYLRLMANPPLHLGPSGAFTPRGAAASLHVSGGSLFCTTSRDDLLSIDMGTGDCSWVVHGPGGKVEARDGIIVSGPNIEGDILALSNAPALRWSDKGDLFALAPGTAYVSRGSLLSSRNIQSGAQEAALDLGNAVRLLQYDPSVNCVVAASTTDLIYILSRGLQIEALLNPDLDAPLDMIRTFRLRKALHVVAAAGNEITCMTPGKTLWKASLEGGRCTSALVMDMKLYVTTWSPGECGGIDSGTSLLQVFDVRSGERVSSTALFNALSFGPLIDLDAGVLEYSSPNMDSFTVDIRGLAGMRPLPLGTRLK